MTTANALPGGDGHTATARASCRLCGSTAPRTVLYEFGLQPVAGYLAPDEESARTAPLFPLTIGLCGECGLIQQASDAANAELIARVYSEYHSTYLASIDVSTYVRTFVDRSIAMAGAGTGDHAIELGSNDGAVLGLFVSRGLKAFGFEPSSNLNALAARSGATIFEEYFGLSAALAYRERFAPARLVLSRHTLEHAFDPLDFVKGVSGVLAADGIAVIEVPYFPLQSMRNHFEALTFQHMSLFTLSSLHQLFERAGLTIVDLAFVGMDGGSIVVSARHSPADRTATVSAALDHERASCMDQVEGYAPFFARVDRLRQKARTYLRPYREAGLSIIAYGAGSKGQSLLNMLRLDRELVTCVRDDTIGDDTKWIPGAALPVVPGRDARVRNADVVLLTATTHIPELIARHERDSARRPTFLATSPDWHIVPTSTL